MIQIAFQPALDPYHTIFRLLRLIPIIRESDRLELDRVRIIDFYLSFPFRISEIRVKPAHRRYKSLATKYAFTKPYGEMPSDRNLFGRMHPIQETALQSIAEHGYILGPELDVSWVTPTDAELPEVLSSRIEAANREEADLLQFLELLANSYELLGRDGLKDRTGLLEYRYDPV